MRISSIQNYYRTNYTNQNVGNQQKVSAVKNVTNPVVSHGHNPVNFTGVNTTAITLAKLIPIEDRLASIFEVMKHGDMLMTGKSLKEAQSVMKDHVKSLNHVLKRFFFVQEDNMDGILAFTRNTHDELEVFNPNKFAVKLKDARKGETQPLNPGEAFYLEKGDELTIKGKSIPIKMLPKTNLSMYRHTFSKAFDFSKTIQPQIERQNLKSVMQLVKPEGIKSRKLSFKDVGGQDKVINDLKKGILYPIKYPDAYKNNIVNHGFIMYGPPGTGKTLIAEALANETNANFVKMNGLEMESKWVGESEQNWRTLFDTARENQPSIIFIDEFDAVAKKRGGADVYGDKVVNQILTLMSDVEKNGDDIFVIAATNKVNMLDDAITRSGRFGKHLEVKAPETSADIKRIFDIHTKKKPLDEKLNTDYISNELLKIKATGADISHIVNSANENAFERAGIYRKMEDGTFTNEDMASLRITDADFKKAISEFSGQNKSKTSNPIGFTHYKESKQKSAV